MISKCRYQLVYAGKIWEIDVFDQENEGLILAECELDSEDEHIDLPSWIAEEVTEDERYYNSYLIQHPYQTWD